MRRSLTVLTIAASVLLAGGPAATSSDSAGTAGGRNARVDITVELGANPGDEREPKIFQVVRQPIEDSDLELDADDLTSNPSQFCGDVPVDVNPVRRTVTIGRSDEVCNFAEVLVVIDARSIDRLRLVRDRLFGDATRRYDRTVRRTDDGIRVRWSLARGNPESWEFTDGSSVFRY